jgi:molecular chaperone GrpE
LDEATKETLLSQFADYLDGLEHDGLDAARREEADLFSVFTELAGLRNEVRTESRLIKEALDRFRSAFDMVQANQAAMEQELNRARAAMHDHGRALLKPLLLDIISIRDRLLAALKSASVPRPRWYGRFRQAKLARDEAWQEGLRMTLRRLDRLLADRRVVPTELVGRLFDPRWASVVAIIEDLAIEEGVVVEELRTGFLWEDELLRPAEVVVAKRDASKGELT